MQPAVAELAAVSEKVHRALIGMGFRDVEARRALAEVEKQQRPPDAMSLEHVLRQALLAVDCSAAKSRPAR